MLDDPTLDPALRSWVASANDGRSDFPIQNLPHGVFRRRGSAEAWRGGVAIGDQVLDMAAASSLGVFDKAAAGAARAAGEPTLNALMAMGRPAWRALRAELSRLLRPGAPEAARLQPCLVPQAEAEMALPATIGDYTDFFTSEHHMLNTARIMMPDAPGLPNFKWLPIAYHGRASSVAVSGTDFARPWGQLPPASGEPVYAPCRRLDYEFELGFWVGPGNALGSRIPVDRAEDHVFGLCLLNDWSARDVQRWEMAPLGPFLAKNFLTSVSPWIVTLDALAPFRCALPRAAGDPPTIANLKMASATPGFDLQLETWLQPAGAAPSRIAKSSFRHGYWSIAQMLAHHAEGGCNLRPGDLMGTGTQSGPSDGEQGCLLELSRGGQRPITLDGGATRSFLEDGDTVVPRAFAEAPGAARIGFGDCRGTVLPALRD